MSATEEFLTGLASRQTPAPVPGGGEGTEALACSEMGDSLLDGRDLQEPRLGSKQPVERKPGGSACSCGRGSGRAAAAHGGLCSLPQPRRGITLGREHLDDRAWSRDLVCPGPSTP